MPAHENPMPKRIACGDVVPGCTFTASAPTAGTAHQQEATPGESEREGEVGRHRVTLDESRDGRHDVFPSGARPGQRFLVWISLPRPALSSPTKWALRKVQRISPVRKKIHTRLSS